MNLILSVESQEHRECVHRNIYSTTIEIKIPFDRDAKPVIIDLLPTNTLLEDDIGWRLSDLVDITPDNVNDSVSIFQNFPHNIYFLRQIVKLLMWMMLYQ